MCPTKRSCFDEGWELLFPMCRRMGRGRSWKLPGYGEMAVGGSLASVGSPAVSVTDTWLGLQTQV